MKREPKRKGYFAEDTMAQESVQRRKAFAIDSLEVNFATLLHCMALSDILRTVF